jgi:hypothetical protein
MMTVRARWAGIHVCMCTLKEHKYNQSKHGIARPICLSQYVPVDMKYRLLGTPYDPRSCGT